MIERRAAASKKKKHNDENEANVCFIIGVGDNGDPAVKDTHTQASYFKEAFYTRSREPQSIPAAPAHSAMCAKNSDST